jgi:hypothetical protein
MKGWDNMNAKDVKVGDLFSVMGITHPTCGHAIGRMPNHDRDKFFETHEFYREIIVPLFTVVEITKAPWKKKSRQFVTWRAKLLEDQNEYISSWVVFKEMTMPATPSDISKRRIMPIRDARGVELEKPVKNIIHNLVFGEENYSREKACDGYLPYQVLCMDKVILEVPPGKV